MITPRFSLTQDADFVLLAIRLPNIRADEGEFYIDGHEVKFHLHPYFLRLTFRRAWRTAASARSTTSAAACSRCGCRRRRRASTLTTCRW